ncbi:MAG: beta-N-acetylhexosaminidase [Tannerella sp.]|nr:beta-N-acetylhexosaminidase [Tannerella sp.]
MKFFKMPLLSVLLATVAFSAQAIVPCSILPEPQQINYGEGSFHWKEQVSIAFPKELSGEVRLMGNWLAGDFAIHPILYEGKEKADIRLLLNPAVLPGQPEGYLLEVKNKNIIISANTPTGILYGMQTLRQMIRNENGRYLTRAVTITDYPAFSWRAFMLDESRHFMGVKTVKRLLDDMLQLKMNTFHWHLGDDNGWRIEIKKYPKLTEIGSKMNYSHRNRSLKAWNYYYPKRAYYTQDEIREIVAYAAQRGIRIIPEMEVPAHSSAAITAYPWLGASSRKENIPHYTDLYVVCDPKVERFITDVLDEMVSLFPSKIIHIGGDEVVVSHWEKSPEVVQFMADNHIETFHELQVWATNRLSRYLASKSYRMIAWHGAWNGIEKDMANTNGQQARTNEKLAEETIIQFWSDDSNRIVKIIEKGYDVVNSNSKYTYLCNAASLKTSYEFDPIPEGLTAAQQKKVLGLGCQMWTEFTPSEEYLNYRVYPRIAAFAETGWTDPAKKDYDRFLHSLNYFLEKWEKAGIEYCPVTQYLDSIPPWPW